MKILLDMNLSPAWVEFLEHAATRASGPSVLQVRTDNTAPTAIGADVLRVLHLRREAFELGALVTVDKARARVRVLPIGTKSETEDEPA